MFRSKSSIALIDPPSAARQAAQGSLTLVDVREERERRTTAPRSSIAAHPARQPPIPGSTSCPVTGRRVRLRRGGRSMTAAKLASRAGIDAWNVTGGMTAWAASGAPIISGGR